MRGRGGVRGGGGGGGVPEHEERNGVGGTCLRNGCR